eukprot:scaffold137464_cov19-Tisochrysis_lutea.AAC.1
MQSGTRSTFLRIDACVRGIDVPSAQQQAAAAMLEALASQIANASCRPPTSTTTRDDQRPSRLGTPLPDQAGPPGTPLSVLSSRPQSTQPGQEPQQNMEATGGALLHVHSADRASGPSDALSVPPSGPALLALATELASVCEGQLQLARACFQWVAMHTDAPKGPGATARVDAPLFASEAQVRACAPAQEWTRACIGGEGVLRGVCGTSVNLNVVSDGLGFERMLLKTSKFTYEER